MIEIGKYRYEKVSDGFFDPHYTWRSPSLLLAAELCCREGIDPNAIYARREVYLHDPLVRRWTPLAKQGQVIRRGISLKIHDARRALGRIE
jgi:hypothetical protein